MDLTALYKVGYGMYIVSSKYEDKLNGQIANTMFQITAEPPTIAVSVNKQNLTHEFISKSRVFSVAILSEEAPMTHIGNFGFKCGKDIDKFAGIEYKLGVTTCPIPLDYTLAALEAGVIAELDCGTHTLFLGKLVNAEVLAQGTPMTYAYYHEVKRGKSPKTAPTYIKPEPKVVHVAKHKCDVCNYVYDEAQGSFEDLPDDWACPVCNEGKAAFRKEESAAN